MPSVTVTTIRPRHFIWDSALQAEGEYTKAIEAYNDYLATSPRDAKMAENGIAGCRHALSTRSVASRYVVKNPNLFNSNRSDFAPFLDPQA